MTVTLEITSKEAETILFALAMRSKQKGLSWSQSAEAIGLAQYLDETFTSAFGWDASIDRVGHYRYPIKSVNIRCFDFPSGWTYPTEREPKQPREF